MPTFCNTCSHVHEASRKQHPRYWLCVLHPQLEGFGFVTPETWDKAEPYLRCAQVNGGACKFYEQQPEQENDK